MLLVEVIGVTTRGERGVEQSLLDVEGLVRHRVSVCGEMCWERVGDSE